MSVSGVGVSDTRKGSKVGVAGQSGHGSLQNANSSDPLALSRQIKQSGPAPVHLWDPPFCGDMDMRIARDGTWYHEGSPIRRDALVKLFSSVLKKEDEKYFLVTPVEKVGIQVDDCPFVVRTAEISGAGSDQRVSFVLNTGEQLPLDEQHYLSIGTDPDSDEPHPTFHVRSGLFALLSRSVFYQLVEAAESRQEHGQIKLGICSAGHFFELGEIKP